LYISIAVVAVLLILDVFIHYEATFYDQNIGFEIFCAIVIVVHAPINYLSVTHRWDMVQLGKHTLVTVGGKARMPPPANLTVRARHLPISRSSNPLRCCAAIFFVTIALGVQRRRTGTLSELYQRDLRPLLFPYSTGTSVGDVTWNGWEGHAQAAVVGRPVRFSLTLSTAKADRLNSTGLGLFFWGLASDGSERVALTLTQSDDLPERLEGEFVPWFPGTKTVSVYQLDLRDSSSRHVVERNMVVGNAGALTHRPATFGAANSLAKKRPCGPAELAFPVGRWLGPLGVVMSKKNAKGSRGSPLGSLAETATVLRSGWTFDMRDCVVPQINLATSNVWILVLGSSTDRGIFLSLVDQLLAGEQKQRFAEAEIEKCWGHYDVTRGGVRLTYQDFRLDDPIYESTTTSSNSDGGHNGVVCHNDAIAASSRKLMQHNASLFLEDYIFRPGADRYPDVVYSYPMAMWGSTAGGSIVKPIKVDHGSGARQVKAQLHEHGVAVANRLRPLAAKLPAGWKGKWVISVYEGTLRRPPNFANMMLSEMLEAWLANDPRRVSQRDDVESVLRNAQNHLQTIDSRLQLTTVLPLFHAKMDQTEGGGGKSMLASLHHHRVCGRPGDEIRICSDVIDFLSRLLLHVAVSPACRDDQRPTPHASDQHSVGDAAAHATTGRTRLSEMQRRIGSPAEAPIQLCAECPSTLVPVHIVAVPNLTCVSVRSLPEDTVVHHVWPAAGKTPCPKWCLDAIKPRRLPSQGSGVINERFCDETLKPRFQKNN